MAPSLSNPLATRPLGSRPPRSGLERSDLVYGAACRTGASGNGGKGPRFVAFAKPSGDARILRKAVVHDDHFQRSQSALLRHSCAAVRAGGRRCVAGSANSIQPAWARR